MWPLKKKARTRRMIKITLNDDQEFSGPMEGEVATSSWVHADLGNELVYFPQHRVRDIRVWFEVA